MKSEIRMALLVLASTSAPAFACAFKYSMVTFREDLPYSVAKEKGNAQDKLLMEICGQVESVSEIDLKTVIERVRRPKSPTATNIKA